MTPRHVILSRSHVILSRSEESLVASRFFAAAQNDNAQPHVILSRSEESILQQAWKGDQA